ncbi:unnamed protein product [Cuscuta campestris]|uniref:CCHC-type domain-containing protein n=1 Tax=Cuscuta campestris TaxID=132261 RepID=A0A484MHE6_9ASTE|nr:unnamed protein product [Cuscuta campestris]
MVNNMDHSLPKFSLLGLDDWKIMMEAHLYALHDCMWMVLEDGPLKIQMENLERNPTNPDVVQYIPKPKEKWDDRDCKKHNLDNVAKAAIFKTLDPITFSKIKHLETAMEIWQGLGKLCEGSEDLRKQKIKVLLEKFKSFKMLPGESFDMLDERFHKILNDLASLNNVLFPKEKNARLLRSLRAEWYTKATAMEEGRNLENYTVQGTCPRSCDTPSSNQLPSSKTENYDEEFAMMVKQFRKFKKFFKKADSVRRPSKGKPQVNDSPPESYLCYNCRKPGHWKSACPYPKVEKYGERERNEKKKKAMVAGKSDESSSLSSNKEALICMERRAEKPNYEDRWTMSEDDALCLMAKDDADREVTSQISCSSSYDSLLTSENLFDKFKKMMEDFEEINLKHSSRTEENMLLSEENLKLTEGRKSQLSEITQLKAENESLSEKVKSLNKELGLLKSKEAVDKLLETTKHKGREGLGFDPSSSKRKGRTTFIPSKPTAKPNKQKGKEKEKPKEVPKKDMASLKNISTNEVILTGKIIRNIYEVMWDDVKEACQISKDKDEEINEGDRMKPTKFIPFGSLPLKTSQRNPDSAEPTGNHGQPPNIPDHSHGDHSGNGDQETIHLETPTNSVLQPEAELDQPVNPNQHNLRWLRDHPPQQVIGDIQSGVRTRSAQQNLEAMLACFISQEFSEFLHLEIGFKYEEEVLEFYKNGKISTIQSKKNPQRTIQVIKSTVGGTKVKISQKKLMKKLHLPNSGIEIGRLSSKNLDWKTIGISGQIPSGPAKKADLKNDYKLVLELVIACLECGSGGHADDITQERAFIINALVTRTKVNWAKHFFNSVSKHLGKPKQKYLCQGLYLRYILESLDAASDGKKYDARYWLYYLSSNGENRASSTTEDEGPSDNVLIVSLKKSSKRKQVVSPSPSTEAPHNLAVVNLDEEEVPAQGELQKKKKRRISAPYTSGNVNPDDLIQNEPIEELYYDWRAWKVGNSANQLVEWDQQLKNERIIKRCLGQPVNYFCEQILDEEWVWQKNYEDLHLEYLATSPTSEFEADDEDPVVYKPILSKPTEDQTALTTEAQADMEARAEDFQVFPETSPAFDTVLPEVVQENAATPQQEQIQTASEEELLQSLQFQVQEILSSPFEISNSTEPENPEKSTENLEKSPLPETTEEEAHEEQAVEVQRSFEEAEREAQIARLEVSETPVAIFEQPIEDEDKDSLSRDISNYEHEEIEEATEIKQQIATVTINLQKQMSLHQMDIRSALAVSSANQVVTQDYLRVLAENQMEAFKLFRHFGTFTAKHRLDVTVQPKNLPPIPRLPLEIKQGELSYIPSYLNMTDLILEAQQKNLENSIQHLSNTEFDGTEAVGTIASHFTSDAQTKERYNNLKRIQEECGVMQGIGEVAGSSKRKKK